jgi:hypothetical protein
VVVVRTDALASIVTSGSAVAFWLHEYEKPFTPLHVSVASALHETVAVGISDHTPTAYVELDMVVGLLGGVVSVTLIVWVAMLVTPRLSVAVHVTTLLPMGSVRPVPEAGTRTSDAIEPSVSVALASALLL